MKIRIGVISLLISVVSPGNFSVASSEQPFAGTKEGPKVAFIADSGSGPFFLNVLKLIKRQGADMVLHQGDLGYRGLNTTDFMNAVNNVLGPDFPYFASRGNHDFRWEQGYQPILKQRAKKVGASCTGDYGQNSTCVYQGLFIILSAGGEIGSESQNTRYIEDQLAADNSIWRICSWHRTQRTMQIEYKRDEVGWGPYEACREGGAIIATGHGHHYARTRTLMNMEHLTVYPDCDTTSGNEVCVFRNNDVSGEPGATFAFVSGLGGAERRRQRRCTPTRFPYSQRRGCNGIWASIYSIKQGASHGALFITFNAGGNPSKAEGEFINIHGDVIDSFTVTARSSGHSHTARQGLLFTHFSRSVFTNELP